ncbi:MAG: hypothetical protein U0804_02620 [Gemmataceae bacterium]
MAEAVMTAVTTVVALLMSEIQAGGGLSLSAAAREFPAHRGMGTLNPSSLFRWGTKGTRGSDGRLVKLAMIRIGSRWATTRGALARYAAELTASAAPPADAPRSPAARTRASEAAAAELKNLGA